jgi:transposase
MIGYNFKSPLIWIDFKEKNEAAKKRKEKQLAKKKKKTIKTKTSTQKKKKAKKATTTTKKKTKTLKRQQIDDPTRLTAATYIKYVLSNQLIKRKLKEDGVIFMQDGAPSHSSALTKAFLRKNRITFIDDWPSHSPDMNPIEQVWAELNRRISENQRNVPSSVEELRRMAEEEWDAIPMSLINSYVLSFHSKCERVVKNKGGTAKR